MKLHIMSDLHLEFHRDGGLAFVQSLPQVDADVLVLAGDVFVASRWRKYCEALNVLCNRYPAVLFVAGNHEHYHSNDVDIAEAEQYRMLFALKWLSRHKATIKNQRFLGTTLWFPYGPADEPYENQMSDFLLIPGFRSWVRQEYDRDKAWLESNVRSSDVIITHHLPSARSVAEQWRDSPLNRFFVGPTAALGVPKLWIHGHTHDSVDVVCGDTRVVANPLGYPHEINPNFEERLVIEI